MKRTILTILLLSILCAGCSKQPPVTRPAQTMPTVQTSPPETTVPAATAPRSSIPVETPCGTLYLPDDWDIPITTDTSLGDPMVISFLAEDVPLYDLTFSASPGGAIGQVQTADGPVYVGMTLHSLDGQSNMLLAMQESVNVLLAQLSPEPISAASEPETDLLVQTPYGALHFPAMWESELQTEAGDDSIDFYCCQPGHEPLLLFTVKFGTMDGGPGGVLTASDGTRTALCIIPAELSFGDSRTPAEQDQAYAMQEDMNYLLEALTAPETNLP